MFVFVVVVVPPLEGFVMNCVGGDYLETLLYKVMVSLDSHTPLIELAKHILVIDLQLVQVTILILLDTVYLTKWFWF